jgi:drug/metabolite transporter (DMT)-like permease
MTPSIAYALAALLCYGLGDFVYKRAVSAGLAPIHLLQGQAWLFCPVVLLYAWLTGTLHLDPHALWGGAAGAFLLIGFYNFSRALQAGAVSAVAPVFRLNFIVTAALAIGWLHEPLTAAKLAGFALSFVAGWLLLGMATAGQKSDSAVPSRSSGRVPVLRIAVATVMTGAGAFCHKLGLVGGATPESLLSAQAIVFCSSVTVMAYVMTGSVRLPAGSIVHYGPAAAVLVGAFLFMLHGLKGGEASVVVPIAQMGFVVAAVLGIAFFGEAVTWRKLAGLAAAIAALLALAVS